MAQKDRSESLVATVGTDDVGSPRNQPEYQDFLGEAMNTSNNNNNPNNNNSSNNLSVEDALKQSQPNSNGMQIRIETSEQIHTTTNLTTATSTDAQVGTQTTQGTHTSVASLQSINEENHTENNSNDDTIKSKLSNHSKSSMKASTYSADRPGMAATYTSEYYESATRGSIDETSHITNKSKKSGYGSLRRRKNSKSKSKSKSNLEDIESSGMMGDNSNSSNNSKKTGNKTGQKHSIDDSKDSPTMYASQTWTNRYTSMIIDQKRVGGWDELFNLDKLFELNMIGEGEYQDRRQKLINQLTGTRLNKESQARFNNMLSKAQAPIVKRRLGETDIIKQVPNWVEIKEERAICHSCHIVDNKEQWTQEMRIIKMATNPFNNGTLRYVYYMMDMGLGPNNNNNANNTQQHTQNTVSILNNNNNGDNRNSNHHNNGSTTMTSRSKTAMHNNYNNINNNNKYFGNNSHINSSNTIHNAFNSPPSHAHGHHTHTTNPGSTITAAHSLVTPLPATHVAKISIDPMEESEAYFQDVAMQKHAQRFADMFNAYDVPKKVGFLDCWVYELVDRTPHVYCGVEKYIEGDYSKYTNNWDWVNVERSTPQAFSHFTYEASDHKILICDLQGVADLYTDPQMHTFDGKGCGKGNMGQRGIDKFLSSHRCNAICRYLKLKITNPLSAVQGTLPSKQYMQHKTIETLPVSTQYTIPDTSATTSLLPSRVEESYDDESEQMQFFPARRMDEEDKEGTKCRFCPCAIL